jgi:hypothetical protein
VPGKMRLATGVKLGFLGGDAAIGAGEDQHVVHPFPLIQQ